MAYLNLKSLYQERKKSEGYINVFVSFYHKEKNIEELLGKVYGWLLAYSDKVNIYYIDYNTTKRVEIEENLGETLKDNIDVFIPLINGDTFKEKDIDDLEIEIARINEIPTIPILMDYRYIAQFNELFKHTECLISKGEDKDNDYDDGFRTKLAKTLARKVHYQNQYDMASIRDTFGAPIFLSYRKKDIALIKKLVSEIHSVYNEKLLSYQIWFDDFLDPGRNYDEEIMTNLTNSNLFILAITPAIFEKNNYVIEIEYPEAIKQGKKIIGVKLDSAIKTKEIKETFPLCEEILDGSEELTTYLNNYLNDKDLTDHETLLLALAYQHNLIVEHNEEISFHLFKKCYLMEPLASSYLALIYYHNSQYQGTIDDAILHETLYISSLDDEEKIKENNLLLFDMYLERHDLESAKECLESYKDDKDIEIIYRLNYLKLLKGDAAMCSIDLDMEDDYIKTLSYVDTLRIYTLYLRANIDMRFDSIIRRYIDLSTALMDKYGTNDLYRSDYVTYTSDFFMSLGDVYSYFNEKDKALKAYEDAYIMNLFNHDVSMKNHIFFFDEKMAVSKGENTDEFYNDYILNIIDLVESDRNRYDPLLSYILSKSDRITNLITALYLIERYTLLNVDSYIREKIYLYDKILNILINNDNAMDEIEGMGMSITTLRVVGYILYTGDIFELLLAHEIYLRNLYDYSDKKLPLKKKLFDRVNGGNLSYEDDYRLSFNKEFFISFEDEINNYPFDISLDNLKL